MKSTVKFQGGGIMVWGAMSYRGTGLLYHVKGNLNGAGYIKILQDCAIPTAHLLGYVDDYWYQDDGAPCHRGWIVKDWQLENDFRCLENWPPQSPDINPIENLWHDIKLDLKRRQHHNHRELANNVRDCWNSVTTERCQTLVRSMPKRIQAVLVAKGGHKVLKRKMFHSQFIVVNLLFCVFVYLLLYTFFKDAMPVSFRSELFTSYILTLFMQ